MAASSRAATEALTGHPTVFASKKIFVNPVAVDPRNARSDGSSDWHRLGLAGEGADVLAISSDGRVS